MGKAPGVQDRFPSGPLSFMPRDRAFRKKTDWSGLFFACFGFRGPVLGSGTVQKLFRTKLSRLPGADASKKVGAPDV